jgi:hypothetical protein
VLALSLSVKQGNAASDFDRVRREREKNSRQNATMRTYHSRSIEDRLVVSTIERQKTKTKSR